MKELENVLNLLGMVSVKGADTIYMAVAMNILSSLIKKSKEEVNETSKS